MADVSRFWSLLDSGDGKAHSGDSAGALEAYNAVLELVPGDGDALERKAEALVTTGDFEGALECYDELVTREPEVIARRISRARMLSYLRRYPEAIEDLEFALTLGGPNASVLMELGLCLRRAGRVAEAIETYQSAIRLGNADAGLVIALGDTLLDAKLVDDAINVYESVSGGPGVTFTDTDWIARGNQLLASDRYDDAITMYSSALRIRLSAAGWRGLAQAYYAIGRYDNVIEATGSACQLDAEHAETWNLRGCALFLSRHLDEALTCFASAARLQPDDAISLTNKAIVLHELEQDEDAVATMRKVIELSPNDSTLWLSLSTYELALGQHEAALESATESLRLNEDYFPALFNQSAALHRLGRLEEALECCDRALKADRGEAAGWKTKAYIVAERGEEALAMAILEDAMSVVRMPQTALLARAELLSGKFGLHAEALGIVQQARQMDPESDVIASEYAQILVAAGHYADARSVAEEVIARDSRPSRTCAMYFVILASYALPRELSGYQDAFQVFIDFYLKEFVTAGRRTISWNYDGLRSAIRSGSFAGTAKFMVETLIDLQEGRIKPQDVSYLAHKMADDGDSERAASQEVVVAAPDGRSMWELYERRFEAEHYLGPEVRAKALIDRLMGMPAETSEEVFRAELGQLTYADLRAFYNRVATLAGGEAGGDADAGLGQLHRDRLLVLYAVALAVINEAVKTRTDHLAAQDVESVQACAPIDKQMENAFRAAYQRRATADDVDILDAAARGYEAIGNRASLSQAGRRVLMLRRAVALDGLARACETNHRHGDADTHFREAAALYAQAGDEHRAAACLRERDAAAQRHRPDADARLSQLFVRLQSGHAPSVGRATVLVDLAELASGNHDDFEAERRLDDAVAELAAAGYAIPEPGGTDRAVMRWMEAIPPGDGEEPLPFHRQISALLALHHRVAGLRVKLALSRRDDEGRREPDVAGAAEAALHLSRLTEIIIESPAHTEAVRVRLEAQLGRSSSSKPPEFMAIMGIISELRDLTARSLPDSPETLAQWREMAADVIARARAYGQPVTLAQALDASAWVEQAADDLDATIELLEEAYEQVAGVPGKVAADQAIIALSRMAKIQFAIAGRNDKKAALDTASTAIELIERDRYRVSAPFQQAALLEPHADLFTIGIFAAWKIATDETAPDRSGYDRMLQLMELSKARASVQQLFLPAASGAAELDQELSALNDAIHALDPAMDPDDSAEEQERRREQASKAQQPFRRQRMQLWDRRAIARRDPDAKVPPVTLAGLQAALEPDEAVIYYYWLHPLSLLVATITAEAIVVERKLPGQDQRTRLERLIKVLGSLTGSNGGLDMAFIEPLAPVLTPVEGQHLLDGKQRLIVSPHRLLHWYPFAAMPYQGKPLIRSFALRYAPNLTSLLVPRPNPGTPRMAALTVSKFPGRPELGELHGVRREAADITAIYSAVNIPSTPMVEPTRAEVLSALRDGTLARAWCLLVDTHGHSLMDEVSRDAPLESVLELADNSVDGYEIAAAELECEVVVFTACYPGQRGISGRAVPEQPGDELFGLSAAFLEARCRSVLAPAWPVDDEAISRIIIAFHRNLAQGAPADIALAHAQRAFLDAATFKERSAYYWAPLMLTAIGRPMPIPAPRAPDTRLA